MVKDLLEEGLRRTVALLICHIAVKGMRGGTLGAASSKFSNKQNLERSCPESLTRILTLAQKRCL
jgi:hypothetical protein